MSILNIKFPNKYSGHGKIGQLHYTFAKNLLSYMPNVKLSLVDINSDLWPSFLLNEKSIMFDYQDFKTLHSNFKNVNLCFKTQYTDDLSNIKNVFPWSQISFFDWDYFYKFRKTIKYNASRNIILNNQRPYGNATERRIYVQGVLKDKYSEDVLINYDLPQDTFLSNINQCLTYVHVPGYSNNMIDRAHVQMFAMGCCVITTEIPNIFPNNLKPIPNIHYIKCKDDYSDLIELIEWCKDNRKKCIEIGDNAKELFDLTLLPSSIEKQIKQLI